MEKLIEGLKEYRTHEEVDNPYFLDIEYHILRHNHPDCLLAVQIRNIDGHSRLLYDVSGMDSMETEMKRITFSKEDMRVFLEDFRSLVIILDKYMLDLSQVCLDPENIFREKNGHYRWIYTPEKQENIMQRIEKLFEWFLSSIDYSDFELVQFTYYSYWCIRNHPFSEETLGKCLDYRTEQIAGYQAVSYDNYFNQEKGSGKEFSGQDHKRQEHVGRNYPGQEYMDHMDRKLKGGMEGEVHQDNWQENRTTEEYLIENVRDDRRKVQVNPWNNPEHFDMEERQGRTPALFGSPEPYWIPELLCAVCSGIFFIALAVFFVTGYMHNMLADLKYIIAGLLIAFVLFADFAWQFHKKRKKAGKGHVPEPSARKDTVYPSYNYSWEEEGATQVLGIRKNMLQPAFKNMADGRVHVIDEFPFYIGSESGTNQMIIEEPSVSRRHAAVIKGRQTGNYDLQDLKSTNGTWVDQAPLIYEKPVRLKEGSRVRFAATEYEFIMLDYAGV